MNIIVTGNPNKDGLAKGIKCALDDYNVSYISQSSGYQYSDQSAIEKVSLECDVFVNCSKYFQLDTLETVSRIWDSVSKSGLIINIGSSSIFWNMESISRFGEEKKRLQEASLSLSSRFLLGKSLVRSTYIAFGRLGKQEWRSRNVQGIDLNVAGNIVRTVIQLPNTCGMHYISVDSYN